MNHHQLTNLCNMFALGTPINAPKRVSGGLLHLMWRINIDEASYAVKQLSSHIDLTNEAILKNYDLTEKIASCFSDHGIPSVSAIKQAENYLTLVDNTGFLIYPWVDAQPSHQDTVSERQVLKIAEILAKMHIINLDVPEIAEPLFDVHSDDSLLALIQKANSCSCPFVATLTELQNDITAINTAYQNTIPLLKQQVVVSHGDLDPKNVLWDDNDNPILIDWECARKLNPMHEIVNASLDWSGITTTNFNQALFIKMMRAYTTAGGSLDRNLLQAVFNGVLGNWINWMVYNIERACMEQECEQKTLGIEQVNQVLKTIARLINIIPGLMTSF